MDLKTNCRRGHTTRWHVSFLVTLLLWAASTTFLHPAEPAAKTSLLSNPDFSADRGGDRWPDDWPRVQGASWETEGGTPFLRLRSGTPGQNIMLYRSVPLPSPAPTAIEVRLRVRYANVQPGAQAWFDARVIAHFKDQAAQILKPEPPTPAFRGTSKGWVDKTYVAKVPEGARQFEIMACLFQAARGTFDLALCEVLPATADQLPKPPPLIASTTIKPADAATLPPELRVAGNRLQTAAGKTVWLQGLCLDSLQWSAGGEHLQQSIPVAIEQWQANAIRLPVTEALWFGRDKTQKDGGVAYRKIVDGVIAAAAARGAYVALDLHRFGAPTLAHAEFWRDAAIRYQNHPAVIFELFNEAHSISWETWRNGGSLKKASAPGADANPAENQEKVAGESAVGMQTLLETVRTAGARNLVIVGGLDWGYDLSGIVKGFALQERPGGLGIIYSSHIYPWKRDWTAKVLAMAAKHPIFVGEVGCPGDWKGFQFIPPSARITDLDQWAQDVIGFIQQHELNWTAFSFHPTCGPNVISDWNYTPTPYWGKHVKAALAGQKFELKKIR